MFRTFILALAAIATLATSVLVPDTASASFSRGIHAGDDWESHIGRSQSFIPPIRKGGGEQGPRGHR
jgi:hypothetical protein